MKLGAKDYLQVAHRVAWFREEHPDWCISTTTDVREYNQQLLVVGSAAISNPDGVVLCNATKWELFADLAPEKAETGAIGRALGFLGYGTALALDLLEDDGERIADTPLPPAAKTMLPNKAPGAYQKSAPAFQQPAKPAGSLSQPQVNRLLAKAKAGGLGLGDLETLKTVYGLSDWATLQKDEYELLCKMFDDKLSLSQIAMTKGHMMPDRPPDDEPIPF